MRSKAAAASLAATVAAALVAARLEPQVMEAWPPPSDSSGSGEEEDDDDDDGDIRGIIEADGLALVPSAQPIRLPPLPPTEEEGGEGGPREAAKGEQAAASSPPPRGRRRRLSRWKAVALEVEAPRPAVVEDEDGDLLLPRPPPPPAVEAVAAAEGGEPQQAVRPPPAVAQPEPQQQQQPEAAAALRGTRVELQCLQSSHLPDVGLQLWAGALVLSDLLLARPELVAHRRVCELGAGLGLCSILAAQLGASSVLCSDGVPEVVENCREVLRRNGPLVASRVVAGVVEWEAPPPRPAPEALADMPGSDVGRLLWSAEVLLAADVVYDAPSAASLAKLVAALLRGSAEALYMALEKRVYFSAATLQPEVTAYPQFLEDCAALRLHVQPLELLQVPVHFGYVRSRFYELVVITALPDEAPPAAGEKRRSSSGHLAADAASDEEQEQGRPPAKRSCGGGEKVDDGA